MHTGYIRIILFFRVLKSRIVSSTGDETCLKYRLTLSVHSDRLLLHLQSIFNKVPIEKIPQKSCDHFEQVDVVSTLFTIDSV